MALAFLCLQLRQQQPDRSSERLRLEAFIVDHKTTKKSHVQAQRTEERLMQMGLDPNL